MQKQKIAMFPGTFHPIHQGHLNVITRASKLFDLVYVVISQNVYKDSSNELKIRMQLADEQIKKLKLKNVIVDLNHGLTIDFAKKHKCDYIIRSTRDEIDFEYELSMAQVNYFLDNKIETIFLIADDQLKNISSSGSKMLDDTLKNIGKK